MKNEITYSGRVTIKVKNKPPVRRNNSGTPELFNLLCNIMAGSQASPIEQTIPVKIAMIYEDDTLTSDTFNSNLNFEDYKQLSILMSELLISDKQVNSTNASVYYAALLPHSQLNTSVRRQAEAAKTCYVLLLNAQQNIVAYAPFKNSEISSIWEDANGQGVVEWEMFFANKKKETQTV